MRGLRRRATGHLDARTSQVFGVDGHATIPSLLGVIDHAFKSRIPNISTEDLVGSGYAEELWFGPPRLRRQQNTRMNLSSGTHELANGNTDAASKSVRIWR